MRRLSSYTVRGQHSAGKRCCVLTVGIHMFNLLFETLSQWRGISHILVLGTCFPGLPVESAVSRAAFPFIPYNATLQRCAALAGF